MHTILGSGNAVATELARALKQYTQNIRLVSRNPQKVNVTDLIFPANLQNLDELNTAIKGSEVVYVTIGFPYTYKAWKTIWPVFVDRLLKACQRERCRLVFFDNMYMYDKSALHCMTEKSSINPPSKKGRIRATIAEMITESAQLGKVEAVIARSADLYGPSYQRNSLLYEMVLKPLSKNKTAHWLCNDGVKHSFTFTQDAAEAMALLGNSDSSAYGQVWHLPTAPNPMTAKALIDMVASHLGVT